MKKHILALAAFLLSPFLTSCLTNLDIELKGGAEDSPGEDQDTTEGLDDVSSEVSELIDIEPEQEGECPPEQCGNEADDDCNGKVDGFRKSTTADVPLTAGDESHQKPVISWGSDSFGVAYEAWDGGSSKTRIGFSKVNAGGEVSVGPVFISSAMREASRPRIAWSGSYWGGTWQSDSNNIYFNGVNQDGSPYLSSDLRVDSGAGRDNSDPAIAWNGSEFALVWVGTQTTTRGLYLRKISPSGSPLGSEIEVTTSSGSPATPSVVWSNTNFGIAWQDDRDGNNDIYFKVLNSSGEPVTSDLKVTSGSAASETPSVAWTGSRYIILWQDNRDGNWDLYFAAVTTAGTKDGTDVRVTTGSAGDRYPSAAWGPGIAGVLWTSDESSANVRYGSIGAAGTLLSDLEVPSASTGATPRPSIAWSGSLYGAVWEDSRSTSSPAIYFAALVCE